MKIRSYVFIFIALFSCSAFAQQLPIDITRGKSKKVKKIHFHEFVGVDQEFFYTFGGKRSVLSYESERPFYLKQYNLETLELENKVKIKDWKFEKAKPRFLQAVHTAGEVQLIFDCYDKKRDRYYLLGRSVYNGKSLSEYEVLMDVDSKEEDEYIPYIKISPDSTKIGIVLFGNDNLRYLKPEVGVFNHDLQPLWKDQGLLHYKKGKELTIFDVAVDNEGSLYTVVQRHEIEKEDIILPLFLGELFPQVIIAKDYVVTKKTSTGDTSKLELESFGKYFHSASLRTNTNGRLLVAGFHSDEEEKTPEGYYSLSLDMNSLDPISTNFKNMDTDFLARLDHSSKSKMQSMVFSGTTDRFHGLDKYKFWDFHQKTDGSIAMIAERKYLVQSIGINVLNAASGVHARKTSTLVAHDIIVVNLDKDFNTQWIARVPKRQASESQGSYLPYFSYVCFEKNSKLHFLFNYRKNKTEALYNGDAAELTTWIGFLPATYLATIDKDGNTDFQQVALSEKHEVLVTIKSFRNGSDDLLTLTGQGGFFHNKVRFARIRLAKK